VLARANAELDLKDPQERRVPKTASSEIVLLGDIGATNARFALLIEGVLGPIKCLKYVSGARWPQVALVGRARQARGKLKDRLAAASPKTGSSISKRTLHTAHRPNVHDFYG
jgi:glucokinase